MAKVKIDAKKRGRVSGVRASGPESEVEVDASEEGEATGIEVEDEPKPKGKGFWASVWSGIVLVCGVCAFVADHLGWFESVAKWFK